MMILLDTNVISEQMRLEASPAVLAWFEAISDTPVYLSTITEAELLRGVANMPEGKSKAVKAAEIGELLHEDFSDSILPFTSTAAKHYAAIFTERKRMGRPISQFDCMIAATAKAHGFKLATRNVSDFVACGIDIINPWDPLQ